MPSIFQELEIKPLQVDVTLCEPEFYPQGIVKMEDSAIKVMTDLTTVTAISITPSSSLDEATNQMRKMKVKLLFVTDSTDKVIGLLTYSDLQGERPIQFQQTNGVSRDEISVQDIMTGIDKIDILEWAVVENARVGDIAMTMRKLNRQHALVLDNSDRIRGIFSTTLLSKSLGIQIDTTEVAQTFAEFERLLGSK